MKASLLAAESDKPACLWSMSLANDSVMNMGTPEF